MVKYTVEKILYLSSLPKPLNVDKSESKYTDLNVRVTKLLSNNEIEMVDSDDSDSYYRITDKGRVKLIQLQISYRKQNGKTIEALEAELEILKARLSSAA